MNIDKNNLYELEILKQVEESSQLSNRMVAAKLDCSVKLAHGLLKKMVQKGFFNVKKLNSRRWDYYLTPHGITEKARLSYEFLEFSMKFYKEARKKSSQVCKDILETGNTEVIFIGSGDLAEICYLGVKEFGLNLIAVYDETAKKKFMGIKIKSYSELSTTNDQPPTTNYIICTYDKSKPMTENYLPEAISEQLTVNNEQRTTKFHWIF